MKNIKKIFVEDNKVNNDHYLIAVIKVLILSWILFYGFFISDDVGKHMKYGFYSLIIVGLGLYATHLLGIRLWTFKWLNKKDILIVIGVLLLTRGFDHIFEMIYPEPSPNDTYLNEQFSNAPLWLLLISISVVPPFVEEFVTRGFVMRVLFRGRLFLGLIVSSIVFAVLHDGNNVIDFIPYFVFGIFVGLAYLKTRRIEVPIMIHFLNNFLAIFI